MVDSVIILFDENATDFTSNGIGYLPDATSCEVSEKRNDTFELTLKYPVTGWRYSDLTLRKILVAKSNPYDKPQAFRIYDISKPFNGIVTFNAEHISYDLSGIPVNPFECNTIQDALIKIKKNAVVTKTLPFTFWSDVDVRSYFTMETPNSIKAALGGIDPSILDIYGGECEFDNFEVKIHKNRGEDRGYSIRYGKNLTDLTQDESFSNIYTGVYPYWYKEDDGLRTANPKIIKVPGEVTFEKIYVLDCSSDFTDPPSASQLKSSADKYIEDNNLETPDLTINVSFVALSKTKEYETLKILDKVKLCDIVDVEFEKLGIKSKLKCIETVYNVLTDRYDSITLGTPKTTLAETVVKNKNDAKSDLDKSNSNTDALIKKTSASWNLKLEEFNRYVTEHFTTVEEHFKNEIEITARGLDARITAETKEIRGELGTNVEKLENQISVTAAGFQASLTKEINTVNQEITQQISQTKNELTNTMTSSLIRTEQKLSADIEATAEKLSVNFSKETTTIREDLVDTKKILRGEIVGASESIREYITITKEELSGDIQASASGLRTEFSRTYETISSAKKTKEELQGLVETTASGLTADFSKTYETKTDAGKMKEEFNASLSVTAEKINQKVSKGDLIAEINLEAGNATINADKININGVLSANGTFEVSKSGTLYVNEGAYVGPFSITDSALTGGSSGGYVTLGVAGHRYAFSTGTANSSQNAYIGHNGYIFTNHDFDATGYVAGIKIVARHFASGGSSNQNFVELGAQSGGGYADFYYLNSWRGDVKAYSNSLEVASNKDLSFIASGGTIHLRNDVTYYGALQEASSIRYKEDVVDITEEMAMGISKLRPVSFVYTDTKRKSYGVIAEEAYEHVPQIVSLDKEGRPDKVDYVKTIPFIIKRIQMLERMINDKSTNQIAQESSDQND